MKNRPPHASVGQRDEIPRIYNLFFSLLHASPFAIQHIEFGLKGVSIKFSFRSPYHLLDGVVLEDAEGEQVTKYTGFENSRFQLLWSKVFKELRRWRYWWSP